MGKEALIKLNRYAEDLKSKMSSPTPKKHEANPATYKQFLERELRAVTLKIDSLKLSEPVGKK